MKPAAWRLSALALTTLGVVSPVGPVSAQLPEGMSCEEMHACMPPEQDELQRKGFGVRLTEMNWAHPRSLPIDVHTDDDDDDPTPGAPPRPKPSPQPKKDDDDDLPPNFLAATPFGPMADAFPPTVAADAVYRGNTVATQGNWQSARDYYLLALKLQGPQQQRAQATARGNLGAVLAVAGHYAEARAQLQQAVAAFHALPPPVIHEAPYGVMPFNGRATDPNTGALFNALAQTWMPKYTPPIQPQTWAPLGELRTLLNLANMEGQLGQYAQADQWLQQAQSLAQELSKRFDMPQPLRWVAMEQTVLLQKAGRQQEAQAALSRAKAGPAFTPNDTFWLGTRVLALGSGGDSKVTELHMSMGQASTDSKPGDTPPIKELPSRNAEAAMAHLQHVADEAEARGDAAVALPASMRLAMLAGIVATTERERLALAQAARLEARAGALNTAIYLGKRAVNGVQQLRNEVNAMSPQARQRYLADRKQTYAQLATWLMQAQRLPEAELVLRLLKEDEGQQFLPTDDTRRTQRALVPYTEAEATVKAKHDSWRDTMRQLCLDRGCGVLGVAQPELEELAGTLSWQLNGTEQVAAQLKAPQDVLPAPDLARARRIASQAPASRSPADQALLDKFTQARQVMTGTLDNMCLAFHALKQQAELTDRPLKPEDMRRVDALLTRVEPVLAQWRTQLDFLNGQTHSQASAAATLLALLMTGGMTKTVGDWSATRQLEELEAQRLQFDQTLPSQFDGPRPASAVFKASDQATLQTGQALLAHLPAGTVAIYYLVQDTGIDMLLVSATGREVAHQAVPRAELQAGIARMRAALQDPNLDPLAPAQALHAMLVAPLEPALKRAGAHTLMLSLDGPLRALPFAALHDGQTWLMSRYALDVYTTASPQALSQVPTRPWRAAAFGNSEGGAGLPALPGVRQELEAIFNDPAGPANSVLPGSITLNRRFTAQALKAVTQAKTNAPNLLHIASHFVFKADEPGDSFILLGDGQPLTLTELAQPGWRFDHLNLVTLSACQTAQSGDDRFGQEIEGLGTLLQAQGAAAVLATLWQVDDAATARLMQQLYRQLQAQAGVSKAEALRQAQLAMADSGQQAGATRGGTPKPAAKSPAGRGADADPVEQAPATFGHPHYWAPFVLMGNWL